MAETKGFQGSIYYVSEATPGTTPANPAYLRFSDMVYDVQVSYDHEKMGYRSIDSIDVVDFLAKAKKPGLKVSWRLQRSGILADLITRNSDDTLVSESIEVGLNSKATSGKHYLTFKGAKGDVEVKATVEDYVVVTATYKAMTITSSTTLPNIGAGSREAALGTAFLTWKGATILKGGSAWAYLVGSITLKVENSVDYLIGLAGSDTPTGVTEGARKVSGVADIFLDDGGASYYDDVDGTSLTSSVVLKCGTGVGVDPKITVSNVAFGKFNVGLNEKDSVVKSSIPFDAKTVTLGTV